MGRRLAPTLLGAAELSPAATMKGLNLTENPGGSDRIFSETNRGVIAMVRTRDRKLIWNHRDRLRFLYDLEKDPEERRDLSKDPAYGDELAELTRSIEEWRSFEDLGPVSLDEDAPVIDRPNVPDRYDDHRARIQDYYREKMSSA